MIRFLDGPAEGVALACARAPMFLRAVVDETTLAWDALDQLDDTPGPSERIEVYRRVAGGAGFACVRSGPGRGCVSTVDADYRHVPGVDVEAVRDVSAWRAWATTDGALLAGVEP